MSIKKGDQVRVLHTSQLDEMSGGIRIFDEYVVTEVDCPIKDCVRLYIINNEFPLGAYWLFPIDWLEVVATND